MKMTLWSGLLLAFISGIGCSQRLSFFNEETVEHTPPLTHVDVEVNTMDEKGKTGLATFGSGCFWCTEAIFQQLEGVEKVVSGYSGGHVENPTYEQVSAGDTGHAEAIQITYDRSKISYDELLEVFWKTHDPTTKDRQGYDVGPQYRSVVFYHDEDQKLLADAYKKKLDDEHIWDRPIVTEIVAYSKFWPAEDYHQDYYDNNPTKRYCSVVITPKIEKFRKIFKDRLKKQ